MISEKEKYDVVIIGAGPAGLAAAIYIARANISVMVLEKEGEGSLIMAHKIDNYPGFENGISGLDLYTKMKHQAQRFGAKFDTTTFLEVDISQDPRLIKTTKKNYYADIVMIATGVSKNGKKYKGEQEFLGKGVSYCATCDGFFYKNLTVSLFGNGDEVAEEAIFMTRFAKEILVFNPDERFECSRELEEQIKDKPTIKVLNCSELQSINGTQFVESVYVKNLDTYNVVNYKTDGVFMYLGTKNNLELHAMYAEVDEHGYLVTNENMETLERGIYAIGDIRKKNVRQVGTAVADGTIGAIEAIKYINKKRKESK